MFKKLIALVLAFTMITGPCYGAADLSWSGIADGTTATAVPLDTIIDSIIAAINNGGIDSGGLEDGTIVNADVNASAAIVDSKLASTFNTARTYSANQTMDDGSGDSPTWIYLGGSNNDTVSMFLDDDAVSGNSDFVIKLVADDGDAILALQNSSGTIVLAADALGALQIDSNLTIGSGAAGVDNTITIDGETSDFLATWMEDEDYLKFADGLMLDSTKRLYFLDTTAYIYADTGARLRPVCTTFWVDSDINWLGKDGNADVDLKFLADTNDGIIRWSEDEDYFKFLDDLLILSTKSIYFGDTGEGIVGDTTNLTVTSGNNILLTATTDVVIPANVGLILDGSGSEKFESNGTDITISVGAGGDINVSADIGITLGDDGERFEGDGTDLSIYSSNLLNLTATTDIVIPVNVGLIFGDGGENIESDNTDFTFASGGDIILNQTTYVGVGTTNPSSELDIGGGTMGTVDGTDDLLVKDDAEIDGDLYVDGDIKTGYMKYDSGWFAIEDDSQYTKTHSLGTTLVIAQVWVSTANDGTADEYSANHVNQSSGGVDRGTSMADISTTDITIVTSALIYAGEDSAGSVVTIDASGYARIIMLALE